MTQTSTPTPLTRPRSRPSLRVQLTLVIGLLAFLPNLVITLVAGPKQTLEQFLLWMLVVALLSVATGYVLTGALLRPLTRLQAEVKAGEFGRSHSDDPAEIVALRGAFGGLLASLQLEQSRRSAFMATLVHDLKTPLIATGQLVRVLADTPLPPGQKQEIARNILQENERLLALVGQMADAHKFERQDVELNLQPVQLREILDTAASRLRARAEARGVTLDVMGRAEALADPAVLERAVTNLTDNAIRYAHSAVRLRALPGCVEVLDDGPGLSAGLGELAQPFNSQPTVIAGQQYTAGTAGLGLFIVRRIAEAHGGALHYERRGGEGFEWAVFSLALLPLPPKPLPAKDCAASTPPVEVNA